MLRCSFLYAIGFAISVVMLYTVRANDIESGSALNDTSSSDSADSITIAPTDVGNDPHDKDDTIMTSIPVTPAPTPKRWATPIIGQVTLVPGGANCGGVGFNYTVYMPEDPATSEYTMLTCEKGYRCQEVGHRDTFRCKVWPSIEPVGFYGQCGGGDYDGQNFCAPGAVCKYISASFSQCLPTY